MLVVEDEADLAFLLAQNLRQDGHQVDLADGLRAARAALARARPDLLLIDVGLPDGSGLDLLAGLRARGDYTPAVFLTARTDEADRLAGFAVGGDDYVTKPYSMAEVLARVAAILRRARQGAQARYQGPGFSVDFDRYLLLRDGREHALTYLEAELLRYLVQRPNEAVSRNELLDRVWGSDRFPTTRTVDTHVLNVRKKLEPDPAQPRHLLTVHGTGYKFVP